MVSNNVKSSLKPIINSSSRILILGSMPGDISLEKGEYYANPRNHFWRILFEIFSVEESMDYDKNIELILSNKLALWDVIEICEREGALDSNIRNAKINDIDGLLKEFLSIDTIILNGGEAYRRLTKTYKKNLNPSIRIVKFPSTSPVPGKNVLNYEEKVKVWSSLKAWIENGNFT